MNAILDFLTENWEMLSLLIYEIIVRVWPTKWNLSILDQTMKLIGTILKNRRVPQGDENVERKADGSLVNAVKVDLTKHIIKSLLVVMLVGVFACSSQAQQWENYKGIRLVNNRDTAQQLAVQGSLFFDDVLDSLYLYDGARWLNLSRAASNGGGGGLMTASNGLSVSGSDVRLGGNLNSNTIIGLNSQQVEFSGAATWLIVRHSSADFGSTSYSTLRANTSGLTILGTLGTLKYNDDKVSAYDDRTVPDWGNVKSLVAIPANHVPYGNGTGITSEAAFQYLAANNLLLLGNGSLAATSGTGETRISGVSSPVYNGGVQISQGSKPVTRLTNAGLNLTSTSANADSLWIRNDAISLNQDGNGLTKTLTIQAGQTAGRHAYMTLSHINSANSTLQLKADIYSLVTEPAAGTGKLLTRETGGRIGTLEPISTYTPTFSNTSNITSILERKVIVTRLGNTVRVDFSIDADIGSNPIFDMDLPVPTDFTSADDVIGMAWLGGASSSCEVITNVADDRVTFSISNNAEILGTVTGYFMYQL